MKEMGLQLLVIILLQVKGTTQATRYVPNPYLASFRTGTLLFPLGIQPGGSCQLANCANGPPGVSLTAAYSSPIANTTQLQCYSFLNSFLYNSTDIISSSSESCNQTHITITVMLYITLENVVRYVVVFDSLVGSPNFMFVKDVSGSYTASYGASRVKTLSSSLNTTGGVKFYSFLKSLRISLYIDASTGSYKDYGYRLDILEWNSTAFTYNITYIGATRSPELYFYTLQFVVVIVNENYFNNGVTTIMSGKTKTFINLTQTTFQNQMSSYSANLTTLAGLGGLRYNRGYDDKPGVIFYFRQSQEGEISVNTSIPQNEFHLNYLSFPHQVLENYTPQPAPPCSQTNPQSCPPVNPEPGPPVPNCTDPISERCAIIEPPFPETEEPEKPPNPSCSDSSSPSCPPVDPQPNTSQSSSKIGLVLLICAPIIGVTSLLVTFIFCCRGKQGTESSEKTDEMPVSTNAIVSNSNILNSYLTQRQKNCCICQGSEVQLTAQCFHSFHFVCLKNHLSSSQKCGGCQNQLKSCEYAVFCARCPKRARINLAAAMEVNITIEQQTLCEDCVTTQLQVKDPSKGSSEIIWIDYAFELNQKEAVIEI